MKPYYEDEKRGIRIFNCDCREVLTGLEAGLILTDPPYNVGKNYGEHCDRMEDREYVSWLGGIFALCPVPEIIYFCGTANLFSVPEVLRLAGARPHRTLGWHKKEFAGDKWFGGPAMCWEPIIWATRSEAPTYNKSFGTYGRDFLVVNATHGDPMSAVHPCPKPLPVMRWLVSLFAGPDRPVIDSFCGSGTTILACKSLGVPCVGIEINEAYAEVAASRLEQEVFDFAPEPEPVAEQMDLLRCGAEIATAEQQLKEEHADMGPEAARKILEGLGLYLSDWAAEKRIIEGSH